MSLWKIAWRSLQQRALASSLTGLSMALGVALVVIVLVVHGVVERSFERGASLGYDIIVGAKGGKLQLVLNTVYHLSTPVENIPYSMLATLKSGEYAAFVEEAIPYCLGDNYEGFRVVATTPRLFEVEYGQGSTYRFSAGRNFAADGYFEAVLGATAAREAKLGVGDRFRPVHGVAENEEGHEHDEFKVVGVLEPTGTPNDRALFINIEGFYLLENHAKPDDDHAAKSKAPAKDDDHDHDHEAKSKAPAKDDDHDHEAKSKAPAKDDDHDHEAKSKAPAKDHDHDHAAESKAPAKADHDDHDHEAHAPLPESQRELTAILVRTKTPTAGIFLPNRINEGNVAQAVLPIREIRGLFDAIVGPIQLVLLVLTVLIVIVSGIGILVSIYNSMSERRREIAIMRALGADRGTVRSVVLLESILLSLAGTGVAVGLFSFVPAEAALIPGLIVLATAVGYLPATAAYRTNVAEGLASTP
jgi:putative ABC transport system permease protein